ncbi:MAG: outer membrane beta-barrel protein [Muribaculaceae bacterium]|nr:outer membrane beta-barrel protein [Muribaculaceae bacterium]
MKKAIMMTLLCAVCSLSAAAQFSVKCQVNDATGAGEPFATVRIFSESDTTKVVVTNVTEDDGSFSQTLSKSGSYVLKVTAVGKKEARRQFSVSQAKPTAILDNIVLEEAANVLAGVTVTAQKPLVKNEIDRLSYDMQADADSKTRNVLDMLRKVPLVSVDGQDNIMVKGSSNFKIYRNGHPDPGISQNPKEILKAIPASMIKRIEVITEPGAKYDAEGVAAILNIVTADATSMNGVTGTISAGVNQHGDPNANGYLTTQIGKVVASVNYGFHHAGKHSSRNRTESEQIYHNTGDILHSSSDGRAKGVNVHYGNIDASYEPDTLNLLSFSFGGYYYDYSATGVGSTEMFDAARNPIYSFKQRIDVPGNSYYSFDGRFDYQHKTRLKGETLTLSYMIDMSRNHTDMDYDFEELVNMPVDYMGYFQKTKENFMEHTFQFDWTRPFGKYHKFETGLKYIHRKNKSHTTMDYDGGSLLPVDSRLDHLTQVGAAYLSYTYSREQWSARAGLRYEYSYLSAKYPDGSQANYHRSLNDWVPSASLSYQINMANSLKWAFATRINRPGISYLNPAVISSPTSESYGNSHLSSGRFYSVSMTYMHISPKFTFNVVPSFNWSNNQISSVQWADGDRQISTYENGLTSRVASLSGFFQWQIHAKTSLMFNGQFGYGKVKNKALNLKAEGWSMFFFSQLTQKLPWKLRLTANGGMWKQEPSLYGHSSANGFYSFGLQRSFLKDDRLTISVNANKPFSSRYNCFKSYTDRGDYTGWNKMWFDQRQFTFSISYRFGSLKAQVKKADKTIENNDVVGGSSQGGTQGQGQSGQPQGMGN